MSRSACTALILVLALAPSCQLGSRVTADDCAGKADGTFCDGATLRTCKAKVSIADVTCDSGCASDPAPAHCATAHR